MTDLFTPSRPTPKVGQGNAHFLADLAENVSDEEMRERYKRGDYPDLHRPSVQFWRAMAGRTEGMK